MLLLVLPEARYELHHPRAAKRMGLAAESLARLRGRVMTHIRLSLGSVAVLCGVGALLLVDVAFMVSLLQWQAFIAIALYAGLMAALPRAPTKSRVVKVGVIAVAAVVVYMVDWTIEKKFVRILQTIETGMTEEQVREIMVNFPEGTGWPGNPLDEHSASNGADDKLRVPNHLVFRPTTRAGDSNWGMVELGDDGRVVSVQFSPD
ncbi:hypothetical protein [Corallococcus carmarthensis]|uniref:hypothetical protein n=1 Tax=Corallococcus carmarthensis TaxID=2316728 RepID=UPI00148D62F9|nr:hypothetical protein [Corallococcus carmarthensis]NOK18201.1 hypothetical protein [Corallococcus carmarthensis]